jgi:hypothetical protein
LRWSRANRVPNTLLHWYRRLPFAGGGSLRSAPAPALRPRRAPTGTLLDATNVLAILAEELDDGNDGEYAVNAWRAEQLRRLGLSPVFAGIFAGLVDWHQIAALVDRGCSAQLALEIVR